ncbi:MAG TPA: hypothetical protein VGI74_24575 [Streptosporangiaceae bacterium]
MSGLSASELAVALYASDVPLRNRRDLDVPVGQLTAWAAQGLARLGAGLIWWRDYRTRQINGKDQLSDSDRAEHKQMWPSARRERLANDAAWRIALAPGYEGVRGRMLAYFVPLGPHAGTLEVPVWSRDLERAARWPDLAAADRNLRLAVLAAEHGHIHEWRHGSAAPADATPAFMVRSAA